MVLKSVPEALDTANVTLALRMTGKGESFAEIQLKT
jgi:hypothetical protein